MMKAATVKVLGLRRRSGVALILTLLVVALLSASAITFIKRVHLEALVAENAHDFAQAEIMAQAGLKGAMTILAMDNKDYDAATDIWADFPKYAALASGLFDEGDFTGSIEDLSGLFNVNYLVGQDGLVSEERLAQFERLFDLLQLDPEPVSSILDWLDTDEEPRSGGAESAYYISQTESYPSGNGPLATLGQLSLIKGVTENLLKGNDERPGLLSLLTVNSKGVININTAPALILQSLDDDLTSEAVQGIMERRAAEPFEKLDDLQTVSGITPEIMARITGLVAVDSSFFRIRLEGHFRQATVRLTAVVQRSGDAVRLIFYRVG